MKILFLVYHGFSEHSGISKKIHYQVKGLRENGHEVHLCYYAQDSNGHWCRFVDDQIIKDYGTGKWAGLRQRTDYQCIYDYCVGEKIEFVYARCFMNANPWLVSFFKKLRKVDTLQSEGRSVARIHVVTEIPTYPYDQEFIGYSKQELLTLKIDQLFRNKLYKQMDALVTFSDAECIFGQRTIRISNGVDFDSIPLHHPSSIIHHPSSLHLIGVAEVHTWHGFDRVMSGIGEYYCQNPKANSQRRDVYFHVVGGVHPDYMKKCFQPIIEKYHLHEKVVFHGTLFGKQLDDVFDHCQFAIGSLGRHRSGITVIKTLKNREYATRGIPFIYSEQDSDFDNQSYVLRAPADESPIDIQQIIDFMDHFTLKPEEIRKTVEHLSWKTQMQRVIDAIGHNS